MTVSALLKTPAYRETLDTTRINYQSSTRYGSTSMWSAPLKTHLAIDSYRHSNNCIWSVWTYREQIPQEMTWCSVQCHYDWTLSCNCQVQGLEDKTGNNNCLYVSTVSYCIPLTHWVLLSSLTAISHTTSYPVIWNHTSSFSRLFSCQHSMNLVNTVTSPVPDHPQ